jgi:diguanylate cyclase (GGDEF)-like protein
MSSSESDPLTPYRLLIMIMLACAGFALGFGALPTHDETVRRVDVIVAVLLVAASLLCWFVLPRLRDGLGLDLALVFGTMLGGYCTAVIELQESQFLVGLGLVGLGVFTAYFRPRGRLIAQLVLMTVCYGVGVWLNPLLPTSTTYVVAIIMIWGISLMVGSLVEQLRAQAMYDSLTGMLNRRGLEVAVASVAANAARSHEAVTVGLIDLDGFKTYNDANGHIAGDQLLVDLAAAWREELRAGDILARYGGDEFALVLPHSDAEEAHDVVRRLHAQDPTPWSVGFADWAPEENLYDALSRADAQLYRRKRDLDAPTSQPEIT